MDREELIKHVIYMTVECGSKMEHQVFEEECKIDLDLDQRKYITATLEDLVKPFNEQFLAASQYEVDSEDNDYDEEIIGLLFYAYVYCIDKAMEATYNLRMKINMPIHFNSNDLAEETFGLNLADTVIIQVADHIKQFELILEEVYCTLKYDEELITAETLPYAFEAMFWGAVFFGVEFCLRLKLEDENLE